ncbi:MAG: hypothetical protein ACK4VO_06125 [Pseudobdellovibrio sp.]
MSNSKQPKDKSESNTNAKSELVDATEHIHFRRCHICGELNEKSYHLVERCGHCQKAFAPFVFFDERKALGVSNDISDEGPDHPAKKASSYKITRLASESNYPPIWGLTVYW